MKDEPCNPHLTCAMAFLHLVNFEITEWTGMGKFNDIINSDLGIPLNTLEMEGKQ